MTPKITSLASYINQLPTERKKVISKLRKTILEHLPNGFEETLSYGMIGYVVPHKIYPEGYHCNPKLPLPFINLASQKNYISLYHLGLYADQKLLNWFIAEYEMSGAGKLDMGKSCIRFKVTVDIPYPLIGKLCSKMSAENWIKLYEKSRKR
jgi:uncharacterized protein YdhG (YjbR/CyaY superfamily)